MELRELVRAHVVRGACTCGKCCDAGPEPETRQPEGHTADLVFFKVALSVPMGKDLVKELREAIKAHKGDYNDMDIFDGEEHGYMEIGGWIGDQGDALMLMGMGSLLGLWDLLTPYTILGEMCDEAMAKNLAGSGMVTVKAK